MQGYKSAKKSKGNAYTGRSNKHSKEMTSCGQETRRIFPFLANYSTGIKKYNGKNQNKHITTFILEVSKAIVHDRTKNT